MSLKSRIAQPPRQPAAKARIVLRLRLPLLFLVFLLAAAVFLPDRTWNTLLIGIGSMFAIAYFWVWQLAQGLYATRRLRFGWVAVGDRLEEAFAIRNNSTIPALWVEIIDHSNVPGYEAAVVRSIGAGQVIEWKQAAICQRRGQFHLGPWAIRSGDPFGIFAVTRHYPATSEIIIHPPIHTELPVPLPAGQSSGRVRARQRSWQATVNAASVRDYQVNDPYHWIHWPTSARRDQLFVRQFDLDAAGDIWLLLDLEAGVQLGKGAGSTEEHAVLLAASLAARALHQNRGIGLATYGRTPQVVSPGQGQGQQWRILRALALVHAGGNTTLSSALQDLGRVAQRGTAAVIITPTGRAGWLPQLLSLSQRGVQSNVILLDRPSFGGQGSTQGLHDAVRQLGFNCHIVRQGEVGQPPEEEERRGFWEFRVTPLGKAIAVQKPGR